MNIRNFIDIKPSINPAYPVEIIMKEDEQERVFKSEVTDIGQDSVSYSAIKWFNKIVYLKMGDILRVSFLMGDIFYSYVSGVRETDDFGNFVLRDPENIFIVGERKNLRVAADINIKYRILKDPSGFPVEEKPYCIGQIKNISTGGLGYVTQEHLTIGSILSFKIGLPETRHGLIEIFGRPLRSRAMTINDKPAYYNEVEFLKLNVETENRLYEWIIKYFEKISKTEFELKSSDPAAQFMLKRAKLTKKETVWDRFDAMQPQCSFGELGICCRNCMQGPCRIDPFGSGASRGICGATANVIVARNFIRMIAAGTASHSEHARHQVNVLLDTGKGNKHGYPVKDESKLKNVYEMLGLSVQGNSVRKAAKFLSEKALTDFSNQIEDKACLWTLKTLTAGRIGVFKKYDVLPFNIDTPIVDIMHRTHTGVDMNVVNLLMAGIRCAIADYTSMHIATDISDILFGTPQPVRSHANLGVLDPEAVNIAVNGHNPVISEVVCDIASEMKGIAVSAGAKNGINVVGLCCTGNEVLIRRGVPMAGNYLTQELTILTGAVDAIVVDYQCIMPSLSQLAGCYHTRIITTMPMAKMQRDESVVHIEFDINNPHFTAREIINHAISAYNKRKPNQINIPEIREKTIAGYCPEALINVLSFLDRKNPLKPLLSNILNGNIKGIVLMGGCNNVNVRQDYNILTIAKELLKNDILIIATGCSAGALAKAGLMTQEATDVYAGERISKLLHEAGYAAGLNGPLPPVIHFGSCVDNSRAVDLAVALANELGTDIDKLPLAASVPEPMSEKAISICSWTIAMGIPTHLGLIPPVWGGSQVVEFLTKTVKEIFGGYFIFEFNPQLAAYKLAKVIEERRQGLGMPNHEIK